MARRYIAVRMDPDDVVRLDGVITVAAIHVNKHPSDATRSDAMREAVRRGLLSLESEREGIQRARAESRHARS